MRKLAETHISTTMDIVEVPQEPVLPQLSRREILALWKAIANVQNSMDPETFKGYLGITAKQADQLMGKLKEALPRPEGD